MEVEEDVLNDDIEESGIARDTTKEAGAELREMEGVERILPLLTQRQK